MGVERELQRGRHWLALAVSLALILPVCADEAHLQNLPRYDLFLEFDTQNHRVDVRQRVTWTNTTRFPRSELVFNFYPHYRIPAGEDKLLARTLEMLRIPPSEAMSRRMKGPHGVVVDARVIFQEGDSTRTNQSTSSSLTYSFADDQPTALTIALPQPVNPGKKVTVELRTLIDLPNKQGRWGHWEGVTFLTNAIPLLAFCDETGWRPMPFVPWHQPWFNEAGIFRATIVLPEEQRLACPAPIRGEKHLGNGRKQLETDPFIGRDFSVLCSQRFQEYRGETHLKDGRRIRIKCLAFPEHEFYANEILKIVGEAIPVYSEWFGPFPYNEFTIAESFFGWNGNECAGLILIDERIFGMPKVARGYVEYLVSHETCHQWWYNVIGTNGYAEPFMDEAAATFFTHKLLDTKRGPNNELIDWPRGLEWLPNMKRENYRWAYLAGAIRRNEMQPAAQDLPEFGHLFRLFTGAYDRGSRIFAMIEGHLGEAAFQDFIRLLVTKYYFRVLQVADFRRELEDYTGQDWGEFFNRWVYGKGMTDWAVEQVVVTARQEERFPQYIILKSFASKRAYGERYPTRVTIRQKGEFAERTIVQLEGTDSFGDRRQIHVPLGDADRVIIPELRADISPLANDRWELTIDLPFRPEQVTVDPTRLLVDSDYSNNQWKPPAPDVRLTPLYSMLDETDLTNDYDRWNLIAGPWIGGPLYPDPWYMRSTMIGARAGAYRTQVFFGGLYAAYRTDYRDVVIGADGFWDHCFHPRTQFGFNYEHRVIDPIGTSAPSGVMRGVAFLRYVFDYSPSLYLPPMHYLELFSTYSDNFLPYSRTDTVNAVRPEWYQLTGLHYRLNLYLPYWDPEQGLWFDLWSGGGLTGLDRVTQGAYQGRVELAAVRSLPESWGSTLNRARIASRVVVQGATPDEGQFFALGGGTLYRGYDLAQRQGSWLWVANLEFRFPLAQNLRWDCCDHIFGGRTLYLAAFYDVGSIYANGRIVGGDVAHALGMGLRLDMAFFSFIERATLRFDFAKTLNDNTGFQFWFGAQHAF